MQTDEAKSYKTLLVEHGKNGGPDILAQDIEYLKVLETTMAKGMSKEDTEKSLIAQFPNKGGKGMLGISMRNLFNGHLTASLLECRSQILFGSRKMRHAHRSTRAAQVRRVVVTSLSASKYEGVLKTQL